MLTWYPHQAHHITSVKPAKPLGQTDRQTDPKIGPGTPGSDKNWYLAKQMLPLQDLEQYWSFGEESDEEKELEVEERGIAELYLTAFRDVLAVLVVES